MEFLTYVLVGGKVQGGRATSIDVWINDKHMVLWKRKESVWVGEEVIVY